MKPGRLPALRDQNWFSRDQGAYFTYVRVLESRVKTQEIMYRPPKCVYVPNKTAVKYEAKTDRTKKSPENSTIIIRDVSTPLSITE